MKKAIKLAFSEPSINVLDRVGDLPAIRQIGMTFTCSLCSKSFNAKQALGVHEFKAHGLVGPGRRFVDDSATCMPCMMQFATRTKCIRHVTERSPRCLQQLLLWYDPFSAEAVEAWDEADRCANLAARRAGE